MYCPVLMVSETGQQNRKFIVQIVKSGATMFLLDEQLMQLHIVLLS